MGRHKSVPHRRAGHAGRGLRLHRPGARGGSKTMRRRQIRPPLAVALMCAAGVALSGVPQGGLAAAPTSITIAVGIDADTLDPEGQTTTTVANMQDYMFDSLVWPEDERSGVQPGQPQFTKLTPQLATSWTVSGDGLTYTFKLRHDVKFQDGTDFNAEAVKFNFERQLDPAVRNPNRYYFADIDLSRIESPDPYTVVLHLKQPSPTRPHRLGSGVAHMLSPAAVKKIGNDKIPLGPIDAGSGPYRFKEWVHGDHITVVKNPNWTSRWPSSRRPPTCPPCERTRASRWSRGRATGTSSSASTTSGDRSRT
ncbi:MAG: hypothetical protein E6H03_07855 [Bacillati bacterium ANGP1]|uniref:Solute-binding protein family 5 domain-containing protein n=1 Tax=Candidatus Segetimicrobium genomatis TaxID=2569760 RepID=A0A537JAX0_9BACT|nr:MAG: hypothetical protein E6H03_07855 [Terrabacteria group bacterium ANGP1]